MMVHELSWTIRIIRPNEESASIFLIFLSHTRPLQILYTVFATVSSYHVYQVVDNKSKFARVNLIRLDAED